MIASGTSGGAPGKFPGIRSLGCAVLREPAANERIPHDIRAAVQLQLLDGGGLVRLDRLDAEAEVGRDFLVAATPRDGAQHFLLAHAELGACAVPCRLLRWHERA